MTAMAVASLVVVARPEPPYFWCYTWGKADYPAGQNDLDVAEAHNYFLNASDHVWYYSSSDYQNSPYAYNDNTQVSDLVDLYTAPMNYYDFVNMHFHGSPDAMQYPGLLDFDFQDLKFGQGGYCKWVWANSCSWFDIADMPPSRKDSWNFAVENADFYNETSNVHGGLQWGQHPSIPQIHVIKSIDANDWLKTRTIDGVKDNWSQYCELRIRLSCRNTGQIRVYLGNQYDGSLSARNTQDRIYLGSISITSGMVNPSNVRLVTKAFTVAHGTSAMSFYLEFAGNDDIAQIVDYYITWSYANSVADYDGEMEWIRNHWESPFDGVHSIMGWETVSYAEETNGMYYDFFRNWVLYGYPICQAYGNVLTSSSTNHAIAAADSDYMNETWSSATDEPASPGGTCEMMWFFPDGNWYDTE